MIDLDHLLERWVGEEPWQRRRPDWSDNDAQELGQQLARDHGLTVDWERGDEEWIRLSDGDAVQAMVSTLLPLALATGALRPTMQRLRPDLVVGEISDFDAEELRATPDVLRSTLLRHGWDDDFDPERFSARDLFVESV